MVVDRPSSAARPGVAVTTRAPIHELICQSTHRYGWGQLVELWDQIANIGAHHVPTKRERERNDLL